jgi:hypothetical protein
MPRSLHPSWYHQLVRSTNHETGHYTFSSYSCSFHHLSPKHVNRHPILEYSQLTFFPSRLRPSFTPTQYNG